MALVTQPILLRMVLIPPIVIQIQLRILLRIVLIALQTQRKIIPIRPPIQQLNKTILILLLQIPQQITL
jgi:hypothetical protein